MKRHWQAVIRETQEELLITPLGSRKLGELWFAMSDCPDILCHVYRADDHEGDPTETDEAVPVWTPVDEIPYHRMWEDDRHWLPLLLEETTFHGRFVFERGVDALDGHAHRHRLVSHPAQTKPLPCGSGFADMDWS